LTGTFDLSDNERVPIDPTGHNTMPSMPVELVGMLAATDEPDDQIAYGDDVEDARRLRGERAD
jgi:hypothetical protein